MERAQKEELVSTLNDLFQNTGVVVVAHYAGLTVSQMTELRENMRQAGGQVKVAKNRLAKRALEGTEIAGIEDLFTGPTCIVSSEDPVAAPKIAVQFAKANENLIILGGAMGAVMLDPGEIKSLASLPTLDELRGTLIGLLQAPAGQIARVVSEPGGQLARVVGAYGNKDAA